MGRREKRKGVSTIHGNRIGGVINQRNSLAAKADTVIGDQLLPGRHPCNCQARIHALVRNCSGCGKIVCIQEGSGPCFFCGTFVCTMEEREIIDKGTQKGVQLFNRLMGRKVDDGLANKLSLQSIGTELQRAKQFRNKLIDADANFELQTKINDLESDYSCIENNPYLTLEEREAIIQRRLELKDIKEKCRRNIVMNLSATEHIESQIDSINDPVIQSIIEKSSERRRAADAVEQTAINAHWVPKGFVPKYEKTSGSHFESNTEEFTDIDSLRLMNEEIRKFEVERRGYAITLPQPCASLAVHGAVKYVRWTEDINLKGPIIVTSTAKPVNSEDIKNFVRDYELQDESDYSEDDFQSASIVGRVFVEDCVSFQEFVTECNIPLFGEGDFVLIFSSVQPLVIPVPYVSKAPFFQLEEEMLHVLRCVFNS
ncbi:hypothetical protein DICVIV_08109 [Dictyocaulus viviparus]|uniref:TRIP4/RQT4 C2HC5-type zinc finger domain-containing protein n=1 Tax=Dictyocaulus viviparus TaxID=29172 RepID=A0A0D8XMJ6_DICVI|nr:hypothetical protein DICVIV_08109 [Dictyocaulus viviparus]